MCSCLWERSAAVNPLCSSLCFFSSPTHTVRWWDYPSARRQLICRLPLTCHVDIRLCRYMDCIAQQVLALRRPSKSLQREWCPTKLSRLRLQMQLQLQQPVQHRTPSRVTRCRASRRSALLPWDCIFLQLLYSTDISMLETHSTHSMGISYSRVHGLKPEKLPRLITLLIVS